MSWFVFDASTVDEYVVELRELGASEQEIDAKLREQGLR